MYLYICGSVGNNRFAFYQREKVSFLCNYSSNYNLEV